MNILFVANRFPYPPYRGDKLKIFNLASRLSKRHNLYLLTFAQNKSDYEYVGELEKIFRKIEIVYLPKYKSVLKCFAGLFSSKPYQILYFGSNQFKIMLDKFLSENEIDVIHTQHLRMSQYVRDLKQYRRILDLPDAYSLYWERRAASKGSILKNIFHRIEFRKVLKYEEIIKQFDLNLVCSDEDKEFLLKKHNVNNIELLPNGVDLNFFKSAAHDYSITNRIIFTGNMDYFPNVDAAAYFVREIFPGILKRIPEAMLYIVGQKPVKKVLDLQSDRVIVTGFRKDLNLEYSKSAIAISPIRYGAGTMNKVLEPMAMGIPVVSTQIGFKGLGINSGEGVLLASGTEDFVEKAVALLSDMNYRILVGSKGKEIIYERFDWDKISVRLEGYFKRMVKADD